MYALSALKIQWFRQILRRLGVSDRGRSGPLWLAYRPINETPIARQTRSIVFLAACVCRSSKREMARRAAAVASFRVPVNWPVMAQPCLGDIVHSHSFRPGLART